LNSPDDGKQSGAWSSVSQEPEHEPDSVIFFPDNHIPHSGIIIAQSCQSQKKRGMK
jgi:hypothetical protein